MRAPSRIRKRFFVVTGMTLAAVVLVAAAIIYAAANLSGSGDLVRFSIRQPAGAVPVLGGGLSFSKADSGNLIEDASFEPITYRLALTVFGGDETTLTVSSEEAGQGLFGDGFFDQASARVLSLTENGLVLKKASRVHHFGINRVGVFQAVVLPGDMPQDAAFLDFARQGDVLYGAGQKGLIVRNLSGQAPEVLVSGLTADLTGISANDQLLAACSEAGDVLLSQNGRDWKAVTLRESKPLRAIAVSESSVVVAVGDGGRIVAGAHDDFMAIQPPTRHNLNDIAYGNGIFVAVGQRGILLTSRNGLFWRTIPVPVQDDWQAVDYRDGRFVVVGARGFVIYSDDGIQFLALQNLPDIHCADVVLLSRQQFIVLDDSGAFIISNDSGKSWQKSGISTGMASQVINLAGRDKIISADGSGQLGLAQLVAEIQLDSALKDNQYQAGDIIYLEKTMLSVPQNGADNAECRSPWQLFGQGSLVRTDADAAPNGGQACLNLRAETEGDWVILSQQIDPARLAGLGHNDVLQVSLWMRQEAVQNRQVKIWLSGPFDPVGATLTNVGTGWKKYTYALVMPQKPGGYAGQDIRLNIAIDSGMIWLDRIFLGRIDESAELLSQRQHQMAQNIRPHLIRLDFIGIGSRSVLAENWVWPMQNDNPVIEAGCWQNQRFSSMHAALSLCLAGEASPWLVVDAYAGEGEILNLIEYLAAPISEPYGRLRQNNGMFSPWTQQFQRVYIEICDRYAIFDSDRLRSEYVNLIIRTISQSPYYRQIKSTLVFVDGMHYHDGVMLSKADYHASDLNGLLKDDRLATSYASIQEYLDQIPRNPDKPATDFPELMRSAALQDRAIRPARLADLADLVLFDLGRQSGLVNIAMPEDWSDRQYAIRKSAAAIIAQAAQGRLLAVQLIADDLAGGEAQIEQDPFDAVRAYAFSSERQTSVVLINRSNETTTCQLISEIPLGKAELYKYDETGQLLSRQKLQRNSSKITILPGGVAVLVKAQEENLP